MVHTGAVGVPEYVGNTLVASTMGIVTLYQVTGNFSSLGTVATDYIIPSHSPSPHGVLT